MRKVVPERLPPLDPAPHDAAVRGGVVLTLSELGRVARLWRTTSLPDGRVFVMTAHEDGVVAFGADVDAAGAALMKALARA